MRFSKCFFPTLKEAPKEASIISHQLMTRAGLIRKSASGIYSILPLGHIIFKKMKAIIRRELNAIGCSELLMPSLIPSELWKQSGRWDKYGPELLRLTDRHGREFCYGPTHEEVVTELLDAYCNSYKQLPVILYQIQSKFRDEVRPRFGMMRGREFLMKDAYSFHVNETCLDETYELVSKAYQRIFDSCGLCYKKVRADNGSIGGSKSDEFMVTADTGEDLILECSSCGYACNQELIINSKKRCSKCNVEGMKEVRGIEVGHIFKLGDHYSRLMKSSCLDQNGKLQAYQMGCYGIGVGRTIAATIEQCHDEKGIIWPQSLAPFQVTLIIVNAKKQALEEVGARLYSDLLKNKIEVLYDDRHVLAGVKFKDSDLMGVPYQIIVGRQTVETQEVDIVIRKTNQKIKVGLGHCIEKLKVLSASDGA